MEGSATENVLTYVRRVAPLTTTQKKRTTLSHTRGLACAKAKLRAYLPSLALKLATTTELNWREPRGGGRVSELTMRRLTSSC